MATASPAAGGPPVGLRPWNEADAPELVAMYRASRAVLALEEPWCTEEFFTAAGQRGRIRRCEADPAAAGMVITVRGAIAGHLSLDRIGADVLRSADLGYWVAPRWRRRGVATRAIDLAAEVAFERLGLARLHATVATGNRASWRALERGGFERVGTLGGPRAGGAVRERRSAVEGGARHLYQLSAERWRDRRRAGGQARQDRRSVPGR